MKKTALIVASILISGSAIASDYYRDDTVWWGGDLDGNEDLFITPPDSTVAPYKLTNSDLEYMRESADGNVDLFRAISVRTVAPFVLTIGDLNRMAEEADK